MLIFDCKYCWIDTFSDNYLATSPKTFFTTTKAPRILEAFEKNERECSTRSDALEITCLRFWEPALAAKPNASYGNVRLSLKAKGRAWEKGKKTIKASRSPQTRCLFFTDSCLWHLRFVFEVHLAQVNYFSRT